MSLPVRPGHMSRRCIAKVRSPAPILGRCTNPMKSLVSYHHFYINPGVSLTLCSAVGAFGATLWALNGEGQPLQEAAQLPGHEGVIRRYANSLSSTCCCQNPPLRGCSCQRKDAPHHPSPCSAAFHTCNLLMSAF